MNEKERKQLVIFEKITSGEISQKTGALRLNISDRWIRKKIKRYKANGAEGIIHGNRGKANPNRWSLEEQDFVIDLLKNEWQGFSASFTSEKLKEQFNIKISRETVRKTLLAFGLLKKRKSRPKHRNWRERKPIRGIMIQLDGSPHDWFEGHAPKCTLLVFIDDATSEILWLEFAPSESLNAVMKATKNYINKHGIPQSFYVDYGSVFSVNTNNPDHDKITQFERATKEIGINVMHARSPQAKGRVERANRTLQDRLVKEMRLRKIYSMETANKFAQGEYLVMHNKQFAIEATEAGDLHLPIGNKNLDNIFCIKEKRSIANDYTVSYKRRIIQLKKNQTAFIRPKFSIQIYEHLDGSLSLWSRKTLLNFKEIGLRKKNKISPVEYVNLFPEDDPSFPDVESRVKSALPAVEATF